MGIFDEYYDSTAQRTDRKPPKHIRGIICDVVNCAYHDGDNYCTAERVAIGPSYASMCADTVCATFKPKQM